MPAAASALGDVAGISVRSLFASLHPPNAAIIKQHRSPPQCRPRPPESSLRVHVFASGHSGARASQPLRVMCCRHVMPSVRKLPRAQARPVLPSAKGECNNTSEVKSTVHARFLRLGEGADGLLLAQMQAGRTPIAMRAHGRSRIRQCRLSQRNESSAEKDKPRLQTERSFSWRRERESNRPERLCGPTGHSRRPAPGLRRPRSIISPSAAAAPLPSLHCAPNRRTRCRSGGQCTRRSSRSRRNHPRGSAQRSCRRRRDGART